MAVFSIIKISQLERDKRIDAKYYKPQYLALNDLYKEGTWRPIRKFLSLCEYGISIKMNTEADGFLIFRMDNLSNGYTFDDEMKYAPISDSEYRKFRLEKNDILFNRVNSEEFVGRTGIFKLPGDFVFASYLVRARTNSNLSPDVLNLFLNSKYGVLSIRRLSRRAVNQANVNAQELQSILMPSFSDGFQTKLTELSNESWSLCAEAKEKITEAEKIILTELGLRNWKPPHTLGYQTSFQGVVQEKRIDAEHYQPKYNKLRKQIRNYANGFCRIGDLAPVSTETVEPRGVPENNFKYIELADINQRLGTVESAKIILGKDAPSRARMLLRKGDVIASSVEGSLDKVARVPEELDGSIGSTGFFVFRPRTGDSGYFLALVRSLIVREQMRCEATGTILTAVPTRSIHKILIPLFTSQRRQQVSSLVERSGEAYRAGKALFSKARRAVEIAIEKNEEQAADFLKSEKS